MGTEYVKRAYLTAGGKAVQDFKTVSELERDLNTEVKLMGGSGYAKATQRFGVEVGYVVPTGPEFDWESLVNTTLVIEKDGGGRILYAGVTVLKLGRRDYDEDKELVQTITFMATSRTVT